jgi:predicted nucleotidyltransferase
MQVFGSVARGADVEGSDVDIAIDCTSGIGLFGLMSLHDELSMILGRSVDLAITEGLKPRVRENFEQDAIAL